MLPKLTRSVCVLVVGSCAVVSVCWAGENGKESKEQGTPAAEETQCKVVFIKHVDCEHAAKPVHALFECKDAPPKATWFTPANAVLLRGTPAEVQQMESLLCQIDVAQPEVKVAKPPEQELRIYPLQHAKADELAGLLAEVTVSRSSRTRRSGSSTPRLRIATDERTNVLVLMGIDEQLAYAERLVKLLDVPVKAQTTIETAHRNPGSRTEENIGGAAGAAAPQ